MLTLEQNLINVPEVLKMSQCTGMQVYPDKCLWFQPALTYLGFLITWDGRISQPDKVQGILNMQWPETKREVCQFVGMVNFYRELYSKQAEILWEDIQEEAFLTIKDIMAQDDMLTYLHFDKPFIIDTDASEHLIGNVITLGDKP
jgi:hypothetical protein